MAATLNGSLPGYYPSLICLGIVFVHSRLGSVCFIAYAQSHAYLTVDRCILLAIFFLSFVAIRAREGLDRIRLG